MPDTPIIEITGLRKAWNGIEVLRGLNVCVSPGSIHAFLGRNGAGKTTTIKILLDIARPTAGSARVFGLAANSAQDGVAIRARTGFVSEGKELYDDMTVAEIIDFTRGFYPRWRPDLEQRYRGQFGLNNAARVKTLSRGVRTKLSLFLALCRGADLLILDEPTAGLDPAVTEEVLQAIVSHVAGEGLTVFFSSHQIAEVEQIADHVTILSRGQSFLSGGLDDIREHWCRIHLTFETDAPQIALRIPGLIHSQRDGRTLTLLSNAGSEQILQEARALLRPIAADVFPVSLKEIFLHSTGEEN
jgi:ABC-2 type transport system ATP-binding protein